MQADVTVTGVLTLPAVDAAVQPAPARAGRPLVGLGWGALMGAVVLAVSLVRNRWAFTERVYEHGDAALNSIWVQNSHHQLLLTGPVSRVGFPHPGPAYLYVLSGGQALFHDWLPLTASAYGAQFLGDAVLQAVVFGILAHVLYRLTGSATATAAGAGVVFWFAATHQLIGQTWLPNLYIGAFALLLAAAIAVAAGRTAQLPSLVFASGVLVHGHVAFILFVGLTWLAVTAGWLLAHRSHWSAQLRLARGSGRLAAGILLLFLAPMVAEVALHYPGPWPDYLHYQGAPGGQPLAESLTFFGHFWTISYSPSVTILAVFAAATALLLEQDRRRLRVFLTGYLMLLLQTAVFLYYIQHGIDELSPVNYYTGWFYQAVPLFLLVLPALHLTVLAEQTRLRAGVLRSVVGAVAVALLVAGGLTPSLTEPDQNNPAVPRALAALQAVSDHRGEPIVLRFERGESSFVAAILAEARRSDVAICLADPFWRKLFTSASMCRSTSGHWPVASVNPKDFHGKGSVIWRDADHVLFAGSVPNLPPSPR
ncbi:MAG TPA: hypothetical protein VHO01_11100 [Jatrophihabitans sp.]|nr:hypothetical protein [Jatrophihabitans sp.]